MRVNRLLSLGAGALAGGFLLGLGGIAAATTYTSDVKYLGCINGHCYDNQAIVTTAPHATTILETHTGNTAPAGYMGAQPRMYFEGSDQLCDAGNLVFTGSATSYLTVGFNANCGPTTLAYSKGLTKEWNGTSYDANFTYRTTAVNGG